MHTDPQCSQVWRFGSRQLLQSRPLVETVFRITTIGYEPVRYSRCCSLRYLGLMPSSDNENERLSEYVRSVENARDAVRRALQAAGLNPEYRVLPNDVPTAVAAAESIGCEVGAIANSLVFTADGEPVMVMASGAQRVDPLLVAPLFGATKLKRADADTAFQATGQHVGGCAPCGHPAPLRMVVDDTLRRYAELWVSGGEKATVMRLTFDELVHLTGGQIACIAVLK